MGTRTENLDLIIRAKQVGQANTDIKAITSSIVGMGTAALGIAGGFKLFQAFVGDVSALQKQMVDLRASVERAGYSWKTNKDEIEAFTRKMTDQRGVIDDLTRTTLPIALDYTKNLTTAESLLASASDLAAAKHMDLETAVNLLGKAYLGHTETLARYGLVVKEGATASETFNNLQKEIETRFGGAAAAQIGTISKQWEILKDKIQGVNEAIGSVFGVSETSGGLFGGVLKLVGGIADAISGAFNGITNLFSSLSEGFKIFDLAASGPMGAFQNRLSGVKEEAQNVADAIEEIAKAADQLPRLFEDPNFIKIDDWWKATEELKTMAAEVYTSWQQAYEGIGSEAEQQAERAAEMWGENGEVQLSSTTSAAVVASSWKRAFAEASASIRTCGTVSQAIAQATAEGLKGAMTGARNYIFDQWKWLQSESKNIWEAMAKDFVTYFVDSILESVAGKLVTGILGFLGSLFDTPANDRMAARQGHDFAHHFARGTLDYFTNSFAGEYTRGTLNLGHMISGTDPRGINAWNYNWHPNQNPQFYGNRGGVTIVVQGSILGTEQFVRETLVPAIQKASSVGFAKIATNNSFSTGREIIAYS